MVFGYFGGDLFTKKGTDWDQLSQEGLKQPA